MPFIDAEWIEIIHTTFFTIFSNLLILHIYFYRISSKQWFYMIKIIMQDMALKL